MTSIWKRPVVPVDFSTRHAGTLPGLLGIKVIEVGEDFMRAEMPVDARHIQPHGILHGGGSVVLAETIGSSAAAWPWPRTTPALAWR